MRNAVKLSFAYAVSEYEGEVTKQRMRNIYYGEWTMIPCIRMGYH